MKRYLWVILSLWMSVSFIQAQTDGLPTNKFHVRSTLYGVGYTNILDTYLSPVEYKGTEIRLLRENMRMTHLMDGNVSSQSMFQLYFSLTKNRANTGNEWGGMVNGTQAWHYQWRSGPDHTAAEKPHPDALGRRRGTSATCHHHNL